MIPWFILNLLFLCSIHHSSHSIKVIESITVVIVIIKRRFLKEKGRQFQSNSILDLLRLVQCPEYPSEQYGSSGGGRSSKLWSCIAELYWSRCLFEISMNHFDWVLNNIQSLHYWIWLNHLLLLELL